MCSKIVRFAISAHWGTSKWAHRVECTVTVDTATFWFRHNTINGHCVFSGWHQSGQTVIGYALFCHHQFQRQQTYDAINWFIDSGQCFKSPLFQFGWIGLYRRCIPCSLPINDQIGSSRPIGSNHSKSVDSAIKAKCRRCGQHFASKMLFPEHLQRSHDLYFCVNCRRCKPRSASSVMINANVQSREEQWWIMALESGLFGVKFVWRHLYRKGIGSGTHWFIMDRGDFRLHFVEKDTFRSGDWDSVDLGITTANEWTGSCFQHDIGYDVRLCWGTV